MMDVYNDVGGNVMAVEEVPIHDVSSYGVIAREPSGNRSFAITGMVEKPKREEAPSNLIISGRYILQPQVFDLISTQSKGAGGEIQLTDAMLKLLQTQRFTGVKYEGRSFDCGSKVGFLTANIAFAVDRDDIRDEFLSAVNDLKLLPIATRRSFG